MAIDPLSLAVFGFSCPSCRKAFYKSLIELVMLDNVNCNECNQPVRVSDRYKKPDLERFLLDNGYKNFILGMRE